jgi:hypothetical protein
VAIRARVFYREVAAADLAQRFEVVLEVNGERGPDEAFFKDCDGDDVVSSRSPRRDSAHRRTLPSKRMAKKLSGFDSKSLTQTA